MSTARDDDRDSQEERGLHGSAARVGEDVPTTTDTGDRVVGVARSPATVQSPDGVAATANAVTATTADTEPMQNTRVRGRRPRGQPRTRPSGGGSMIAHAVLVEEGNGAIDLPIPGDATIAETDVEAVPTTVTTTITGYYDDNGDGGDEGEGEENPHIHTVRLDYTHLVPTEGDGAVFEVAAAESNTDAVRPEFKSVILVNKTSYGNYQAHQGVLGIRLTRAPSHGHGNGGDHHQPPRVSYIDPESPFAQSAVEVGDVLLSINKITCNGLDPDRCSAELLASTLPSSSKHMTTTVRFQSVGGNGYRVVTTVEKISAETSLGITFRVNSRGSILISSVSPTKILALSLFNVDDRIISVNGVDCTNTSSVDAKDVARLIRNAPRWVTIVSETSGTTGVVIAASNDPVSGSLQVARNELEVERDANNKGSKTYIIVALSMVVIIITAVVVPAIMSNASKDPVRTGTPTEPNGGPPPPNDSCFTAIPITTDGSTVLGTNQYASRLLQNSCYNSFGQENTAVWYSFTASEDVALEVSTCQHQNSFDTRLIIYSGSCDSLMCMGENDDGWTEGLQTCGSASAISVPATKGETYFAVVQGFGGDSGSFGIKVEQAGNGIACLCLDIESPPPRIQPPASSELEEPYPPNDTCSRAIPLVINGSAVMGTNQNATGLLPSTCARTEGAAVWYTFTANQDDTLQISTCEDWNSIDTQLTVYSGSCNLLTCVGHNDDGTEQYGISEECTVGSALAFPVKRGETYFAAVQGFDNATGGFAIKVESTVSAFACLCQVVAPPPRPDATTQTQAPIVVPPSPSV